ncbi:hypothetical protein EVA_14541 [gut metagenome]|uniref:Uncharacterized protein n=1 Tax=gut metagenome TaxID=749906 RepID=J9FS78_9ZZZZ
MNWARQLAEPIHQAQIPPYKRNERYEDGGSPDCPQFVCLGLPVER